MPPLHFFKILLSNTLQDHKLEIPSKFIKFHGKNLSDSVSLKVPTGEEWVMQLTRKGNKIWLDKGWQQFADYYPLKLGYMLVFRLHNCSGFHVLIFDRTASEIDYAFSDSHGCENRQFKAESFEEDGQFSLPEKSPLGLQLNKQRLRGPVKAMVLERARGFKSEHPFFVVAMQPSYVNYQYRLTLPSNFVNHIVLKKHVGEVILMVPDGRTWRCKYYTGHSYKLYAGWKNFVEENDLHVGDVCIFEMIKYNGDDILFKVLIDKESEDKNFHLTQAETQWKTKRDHKRERLKSALKEAREFTSVNPFFISVMGRTALHYNRLYVPKPFEVKCGTAKLRVRDKLWLVTVKSYPQVKLLGSGWNRFTDENDLELGDVCVFELINGGDVEMKVHIFKRSS